MSDDPLFRRLYPEWTGDIGPLFNWVIFLMILFLIVALFYLYQRYLEVRFWMILRKIGLDHKKIMP